MEDPAATETRKGPKSEKKDHGYDKIQDLCQATCSTLVSKFMALVTPVGLAPENAQVWDKWAHK